MSFTPSPESSFSASSITSSPFWSHRDAVLICSGASRRTLPTAQSLEAMALSWALGRHRTTSPTLLIPSSRPVHTAILSQLASEAGNSQKAVWAMLNARSKLLSATACG